MRIIGIIVLILFVVVLAAGAYLLVTFDVNSVKTLIEDQLKTATGYDVRLGQMRLKLGITPVLGAEGITLRKEGEKEPLAQAEKLEIYLDLTQLLKKNITISRVLLIEPKLYILHKADASWNWLIEPAAPSETRPAVAASPDKAAPAESSKSEAGSVLSMPAAISSGWLFELRHFEVRNATLHFVEQSVAPEFQTTFTEINLRVEYTNLRTPLKLNATALMMLKKTSPEISLSALYDMSHHVLSFNLDFDRETLLLEGTLRNLAALPQFQGKIGIRGLDLDSVTPANWQDREHLTGILTADMNGSFIGTHPELIKNTVTLDGAVEIRDGAIKNINVINQVLSQMGSIPGIQQVLAEKMPPELETVTHEKDTPFERFQATLRVFQGRVFVEPLDIKHSLFYIQAAGNYGFLESDMAGKASLILLDEMSAYLVKKIHELKYFLNSQNRLVIPFQFRGVLPGISVYPDLGAVTRQVIQNQGQELITKGLAKLSEILAEKSGATPSESDSDGASESGASGQTLTSLF